MMMLIVNPIVVNQHASDCLTYQAINVQNIVPAQRIKSEWHWAIYLPLNGLLLRFGSVTNCWYTWPELHCFYSSIALVFAFDLELIVLVNVFWWFLWWLGIWNILKFSFSDLRLACFFDKKLFEIFLHHSDFPVDLFTFLTYNLFSEFNCPNSI